MRSLPEGSRKVLDVALSVILEPKVLLMDEPTSGVSAGDKFSVMDTLMPALGTPGHNDFVEHDMEIIERYAERAVAFDGGKIIAEERSPRCWRAGSSPRRVRRGLDVLRVTRLTVSISAVTILRGLSLAVEAGHRRAGRPQRRRQDHHVAQHHGPDPPARHASTDGNRLDGDAAYTRARLGIGYLPEDRRLVGPLSVRDNLLIPGAGQRRRRL